MSPDGHIFQSSFKGYDKSEVEEYIKKLYGEGEKNLAELNMKIDDISYKNRKIREEIEKALQENNLSSRSKDFLEFLEARVQNAREFMNAEAENEIKAIESASIEKSKSLDEEIEELKKYFRKIRDNFNVLVETVLKPEADEEKNGFKLIQYSGKTERRKMLENDNTGIQKNAPELHILGKVSGKDIKSKSGQLIVAKGEAITEEIIEKAENAGKLSELIINMTTPRPDGNF